MCDVFWSGWFQVFLSFCSWTQHEQIWLPPYRHGIRWPTSPTRLQNFLQIKNKNFTMSTFLFSFLSFKHFLLLVVWIENGSSAENKSFANSRHSRDTWRELGDIWREKWEQDYYQTFVCFEFISSSLSMAKKILFTKRFLTRCLPPILLSYPTVANSIPNFLIIEPNRAKMIFLLWTVRFFGSIGTNSRKIGSSWGWKLIAKCLQEFRDYFWWSRTTLQISQIVTHSLFSLWPHPSSDSHGSLSANFKRYIINYFPYTLNYPPRSPPNGRRKPKCRLEMSSIFLNLSPKTVLY